MSVKGVACSGLWIAAGSYSLWLVLIGYTPAWRLFLVLYDSYSYLAAAGAVSCGACSCL